jgi:hypothetical protein
MADNTVLNPGSGGDTVRTVAKSGNAGAKSQIIVVDVGGGADGSPETALVVGQQASFASLSTVAAAMTPLGPGQYGVSPISATALTIPSGALYAVIQAYGGNCLRYTTDGLTTPTTSVGMWLEAQSLTLVGPQMIANFRIIAASSGATFSAEYFK